MNAGNRSRSGFAGGRLLTGRRLLGPTVASGFRATNGKEPSLAPPLRRRTPGRPAGRPARRRLVSAAAAVATAAALVGLGLQPAAATTPHRGHPRLVGISASPQYSIQTRLASASPAEPGDHFEVTVGGTPFAPPAPPAWRCPTGVWVLVLNRASLGEDASDSGDFPLCSNSDANALGYHFKALDGKNDLVIVNSLNHNPNGPPTVLTRLGYAMQEIGACCAPSADHAVLPPFSTVDLARSSFSLVGMPGLAPGTADTNVAPIGGDTVPAGSLAAASIGGTLVQDQNQNYTLVHYQAVGFDIATDGTITIGGHSYPVPSPNPASCGGCGGFHVLAVDRQTLAPLLDRSYMTNDTSCACWRDQGRMAADLQSLDRENVLFFIASVGIPEIPAPWAYEWPGYNGWTVRLFDWLVHFGATPGALNDLVSHPRYALVGASSPPAPAPVFGSAEASSEVAQAAHPDWDVTATGELQGVLGIGHANMWYQPVMSNAPLVKVIAGQPQPPTEANFGLALLLANTTAPWPYTAPDDPDRAAYQAAYTYISDQLCTDCNGNVRNDYDINQNTIKTWHDTDLPQITYPASGPPPAFTEQQFTDMKTEIGNELNDVYLVDGNKHDMTTILDDSVNLNKDALDTAYTTVKDSLPVSKGAEVLSIMNQVFLGLLHFVPEVGPALGSTITFAEDVARVVASATAGHDPAGDLQVQAGQLATQAKDAFLAGKTTLDSEFDRIYSDYGKLSTLANHIDKDPADWDLNHNDGISKADASMEKVAEIAYYQSLLPAVYDILHGQDMKITALPDEPPVNPQQPPPLYDWCVDSANDTGCFGKFQYGISAYAFPNDQFSPGNPGWDVIALQEPPAQDFDLAGDPIPATIIKAINSDFVDPADVFLRWPLDRIYCKVGDTTACQVLR